MKIAIFSDNFWPEITGISDSIVLLGKELVNLGHEIHFFAPYYSAKDFKVANIEPKEMDLGKNIKIHRLFSFPYIGSPTKQSRLVIPLGIQSFKCRKEKFDIIYTQDPFGAGLEALLMSRILKIPLVGANHTPITEFTRYSVLHSRFLDWFALRTFSWYYNRCLFITTPFQGLLDEMRLFNFKKPGKPLSNPIDLKDFTPVTGEEERKNLKNKFGLSEKVVLYTGRLAVEKQIDVIIKAMVEVKKIFPEAMLAITGCGNWDKKLNELTEELGLKNNVKFFGRVGDEEHIEIYKASDVFTMMSTAESQSLSLMKAMATGLPVIGADSHALPDYIGKENSDRGFVVPVGDVQKLAEKIIFLLGDEQKRKMLGQGGLAFVQKFSARNIALEWQKIFVEAIDSFKSQKK